MPEVSSFIGLKVYMNFDEHNPPHIHVKYGDFVAIVDIREATVIRGALPKRHLKLILAWCEIYRAELMENWELARNHQPLNRINPL